jgi:hypothetical protein
MYRANAQTQALANSDLGSGLKLCFHAFRPGRIVLSSPLIIQVPGNPGMGTKQQKPFNRRGEAVFKDKDFGNC